MENIFESKSFAVIGASRDFRKVGHVVFKNLIERKIKAFPINPNAKEILGKKCYKNLNEINERIDCAIIAIKADFTLEVLEEINKNKIKSFICKHQTVSLHQEMP